MRGRLRERGLDRFVGEVQSELTREDGEHSARLLARQPGQCCGRRIALTHPDGRQPGVPRSIRQACPVTQRRRQIDRPRQSFSRRFSPARFPRLCPLHPSARCIPLPAASLCPPLTSAAARLKSLTTVTGAPFAPTLSVRPKMIRAARVECCAKHPALRSGPSFETAKKQQSSFGSRAGANGSAHVISTITRAPQAPSPDRMPVDLPVTRSRG
jgi:hypothetical protein